MNIGGLGYADDGAIYLPDALLRALHIGTFTSVYLLYYPTPSLRKQYDAAPNVVDFMLTSVPPRYWQASIRATLHLRHEPGTLAQISAYLRERGLTILQAESSRAAHRYATWNLTMAREDLAAPAELRFDAARSAYRETEDLASSVLRDLSASPALYREDADPSLNPTVSAIQTLHFFNDHRRRVSEQGAEGMSSYPEQYRLSPEFWQPIKCLNVDGILRSADPDTLHHLFSAVEGKTEQSYFPSVVFAESDGLGRNLRMALIPQYWERRLFDVVVRYRRNIAVSSLGLLSQSVQFLPASVNIWRLYNKTMSNEPQGEEGLIRMVLDSGDIDVDGSSEAVRRAIGKGINAIEKLGSGISFPHGGPNVRELSPRFMGQLLKRERAHRSLFDFDVFISYANEEVEIARELFEELEKRQLAVFFAGSDVKTGQNFPDRIREGLLKAREVCLVWSASSKDSRWVTTEWGVAWAQSKLITPVVVPPMGFKDLPPRLLGSQGFEWPRSSEEIRNAIREYAIQLSWNRDEYELSSMQFVM